MWQRQIHFVLGVVGGATADELAHRGRLRVVHHDEVPLSVQLQRVVEDALEVDALHSGVPLDLGALQGVVHGLGDAEELVAAVDHLPLGFEADIAGECNVCREQFGDAAAVRGGVHVEDAGAGQRLGELADAFDRPVLDDALVVVEVLVEQRDTFEHGRFLSVGSGAKCARGRSSGQSIARGPRCRVS